MRQGRRAGGWRRVLPPAALDLALAALVTALALAVRWPGLLTAPAFTDEMDEVLLGLRVARGGAWPLTGVSGYLGPLHTYLLAGLLALLGPSLALPRLLVLALASLTAGLTYLLGRQVGGRGVGLLAAALLVTTPVHLIVTSHIAWQHNTAPFWTAAALFALRRAWPGGGRWLIAGSLLTGVAVQTHPVVATLLPGMLVAWAWSGRPRCLPRRDMALAVVAGLAPLLPLLWANAAGGWPALRDAEQRPYAYAAGAGPAAYVAALVRLLAALPRAAAGSFSEGLPVLASLAPWPVLVASAALVAGLAWAVHRDERLLLGVVLATVLLLPAINRDYLLPLQGRFLAHLAPVLAVLVAGALVAALGAGWRLAADGDGTRHPFLRRLTGHLLVAVVVALALAGIVGPLAAGRDYLRQLEAVGMGNEVILALTGALAPARHEAVVAVDARLADLRLPGNSTMLRGLTTALALEGVDAEVVVLPGLIPPAPPGRVRYLLLYPGASPPPGGPWTLLRTFPERTRLGIYSADLYGG
ncbi:MAG: glycosyltransferase family 39 protein [Chloroflexi bacterium]|nr:glycosyltransferase family 39 protein [Chloroflexota bacterium]